MVQLEAITRTFPQERRPIKQLTQNHYLEGVDAALHDDNWEKLFSIEAARHRTLSHIEVRAIFRALRIVQHEKRKSTMRDKINKVISQFESEWNSGTKELKTHYQKYKVPDFSQFKEEVIQLLLTLDEDSYLTYLIDKNKKLVLSIAKKYQPTAAKFGIPFLDLVCEGLIGLSEKAIPKYDLNRGNTFSTCAYHWIRQPITASFGRLKTGISVERTMNEQLRALANAVSTYRITYGEEPSNEELAKEMNIPAQQVKVLRSFLYSFVSLEESKEDDEGELVVLQDMIPDPINVEWETENNAMKSSLLEALNCLTETQRSVLILRYGLSEQGEFSTEETSLMLGLQQKNVSSHLNAAVRKLKKVVGENHSLGTQLLEHLGQLRQQD